MTVIAARLSVYQLMNDDDIRRAATEELITLLRLGTTSVRIEDPRRLAEALAWRAYERELRCRGWSRKRAAAYIAQLKRRADDAEKPGLLARLLACIRG